MDSEPSEIVGLIASYVNPKDVVAMKLTNQNLKRKLDGNRRILPKPLVDVKITGDEEYDNLSLEMSLPARGWTWISELVEAAPEEPETTPEAEDEKRGMVADFYMNKTERREVTRGQFAWGMVDGLSLHLHFIISHMQIRTLSLKFPQGEDVRMHYKFCDDIERLMKDYRTGAEELRFDWDRYHMGLIETCNPTSLSMKPGEVYSDFYLSPTIRKLQKLVMSPAHIYDNELPVLSARYLELDYWGHSMITIDGIGQFLKQWSERKREISHVVFDCGQDEICLYEEWSEMLSNLDQNLVVVTIRHDETSTLRRISDGVSIQARWVSYRIKMEAFTVVY